MAEVAMINVKLKKRLICDGKFRMDGYEGQMDVNRANYLAALGEVEVLPDVPEAKPGADELGLSDEPDAPAEASTDDGPAKAKPAGKAKSSAKSG